MMLRHSSWPRNESVKYLTASKMKAKRAEPFDFNAYLMPMRQQLEISGSWPKSNPSLKYKIIGHANLFILTLITVSSVVDIFINIGNVANVIYAMCIVVAVVHSIAKHIILLTNKDKFFKLLNLLQDPIFTAHGNFNIYLSQKIRSCTIARRVYIFSAVSTAAFVSLSPIFGLSERKLPAPFPFDMKNQSFLVYVLVWISQILATIVAAWVIPGYDGLIVFFVGIAAAELKILREKIIHSTDRRNDDLINRKLRQCVIHHVAIERYIHMLQDMFAASFLIQVFLSFVITVFVGVNFIITPVASPEFGRNFFFFMAVIIELILFYVPANEIILQSEKIRDACYMSMWIDCGPSVRKTMCIIMERSKKPFSLSAAKFVELSIQSLVAVLKSSLSYFTVLRQLYSESNAS